MLGFHTASDISRLMDEIWKSCMMLGFVSTAILASLVIKRWVDYYAIKGDDTLRRDILRHFQAAMNPAIKIDGATLKTLPKGKEAVACDVALDLLRTLRGEETQRIIETLRHWRVQEHMAQDIAHGSRGEVIRALTLLSRFSDRDSLNHLFRATAVNDLYIHLTALRGIADNRDSLTETDMKRLVKILCQSHHTSAWMAGDILKRLGPASHPALVHLCRTAESDTMKTAALIALNGSSDPDASRAARSLIHATNPTLARAALATLVSIEGDKATEALIDTLSATDSDTALTLEALHLAGKYKIGGTALALATLLQHDAWDIRFRAALALTELRGGASILEAAAKKEDTAGIISRDVLREKGLMA